MIAADKRLGKKGREAIILGEMPCPPNQKFNHDSTRLRRPDTKNWGGGQKPGNIHTHSEQVAGPPRTMMGKKPELNRQKHTRSQIGK